MVVAVVLNLLLDVVRLHARLLRELLEHVLVDLQFELELRLGGGGVLGVELTETDLLDGQPLERVDVEDAGEQMPRLLGEVARHVELAEHDLVVERLSVGVVEGQVAAQQREQNHA